MDKTTKNLFPVWATKEDKNKVKDAMCEMHERETKEFQQNRIAETIKELRKGKLTVVENKLFSTEFYKGKINRENDLKIAEKLETGELKIACDSLKILFGE